MEGIYKEKETGLLVQVTLDGEDFLYPYVITNMNGAYITASSEKYLKEKYEYIGKQIPVKEIPKHTNKTYTHLSICEELNDVYKRKNADYGDSFGQQYAEFGIISSAIRLEDKMKRFKQLIKNEAQVKDESIEDTLLDLANYAIMTVIELRGKR